MDADDLLDDLLQMVWALHDYGGELPSWYVFRLLADDVKVGLTGTGGDELAGNYRRFVPFEAARLARWRQSFSVLRRRPSYYFRDEEARWGSTVRARASCSRTCSARAAARARQDSGAVP